MPFFTLSSMLAEGELVEGTYTAVEALPTTKRVALFSVKEFATAALKAYVEAWWCIRHPPGTRPRSLWLYARDLNNLTLEPVPIALNWGSTLLVDVSIPTGEGLLFNVDCVYPGRPGPGPKLVRVVQMFLRLLSTFLLMPLTSMLRTCWSTRLIN